MSGTAVVRCQAVELDRRTGYWCDGCAVPSVAEIDWAIALVANLHVIGRFTAIVCTDCGKVSTRPL